MIYISAYYLVGIGAIAVKIYGQHSGGYYRKEKYVIVSFKKKDEEDA